MGKSEQEIELRKLRNLCNKYNLPALLERAAVGVEFGYRSSPEQATHDATALRELARALEEQG